MNINKGILFSIALLLTVFVFQSCYYGGDNNVLADDDNDCESVVATFNAEVAPILDANCNSCHNRSTKLGGVNLEGYNNVLNYARSGSLVGSIQHANGYAAMPPNAGKLSACDIAYVKSWVDDGAENN